MRVGPVGVAIVGAGVISAQYLRMLTTCSDVTVLGIADSNADQARAKAEEFGIPLAGDVDTVLGTDDVEIVVNLTVPAAHAQVARQALAAGKHVYGEKPLVTDPVDGEKLLAQAAEAGLRVGCAPDTFLGPGLQASIRALASGVIGEPVSATTAIMNPGPEKWHPSPEFLFARGGGPLFDLGPYYLTALVSMLGPVARVAAVDRKGRAERVIGSGPKEGTAFPVEVPTHVTALLDFVGGPSAVSTFSFDSADRRILLEIIGTEGSLSVPNPNMFGGDLRVKALGDDEWRDLPVGEDPGPSRGYGVVEMARALRAGVAHRASGELAQHVLELMTAIAASGATGAFVPVASRTERPELLPEDWDPRAATL